jgi:hypothetical protein
MKLIAFTVTPYNLSTAGTPVPAGPLAKVNAPDPDKTFTPPIFEEVKAATEPALAASVSTQNKLQKHDMA